MQIIIKEFDWFDEINNIGSAATKDSIEIKFWADKKYSTKKKTMEEEFNRIFRKLVK